MKIFIDFDDVVFNTKKFVVDYKKVFQKNNISDEDFNIYITEYNTRFKNGDAVTYNPNDHILSLKNELDADLSKLKKDLDNFMVSVEEYIFDDFYDFAKKVGSDNLYLVSYGNKDFQNSKIKNSGVEKFFNKITITDGLKSSALKNIDNNESIYFLDDQLRHIEDVKKNFPRVITFFVKRKDGRHLWQNKNEYCDFVIQDLNQVCEIII